MSNYRSWLFRPKVVPDLFRDHPWTETRPKSEYEDWRLQQDVSRIRHDVLAAYQELRRLGLASSLGMIGFCFGGGRLMDEISLAEAGLNPKAAVAYYPTSTYFNHISLLRVFLLCIWLAFPNLCPGNFCAVFLLSGRV